MADYGYLHIGRVLGQDETSGGYYLESVALARDRKFGPCMSCVAGLQPGDKVVLAATGASRDSLIILGMLDPRYPDLADIPGLTAALAAKADVTALEALEGATNLEFQAVNDKNDEQDGRLTAAEDVNTTQDSRLTAVEGVNTTQNTRLTTAEGTLTTHAGQISNLINWSPVFQAAHEFDVYSDLISSYPRGQGLTNTRLLVNGAVYLWRTRVRVGMNISRLRLVCTNAGVGAGLVTAGLFTSTTAAGPYAQVGTGTNTLTATGVQAFNFASAVPVNQGTYVVLLFWVNSGYTTPPRIGTPQNAALLAGSLNPAIVWGTKVGVGAMPASVTITDGTWTPEVSTWWIAAN